ncbi:hypothetical protein KTO58_10840 [Chitinophaga pendula]|uniref:hypothetical protein n=1 Tax=Chitinophaga TaxID=79328 RepID=UPI000BAE6E2C|nr:MULTISPECIES: hypothetical protein [Chitinophaga]ASZ12724.1 hypothetical protein CK934_18060 [Chitinophaga sp. MD30]UCJ09660.1 hypothetical protein KTO58_10840 [Chitinophaga pendula]
MEKTDRYIMGRFYWKAKQYHIPSTSSCYYEQLDDATKQRLAGHIQHSSGIPALFFTGHGKTWTLLCTRQVIGYNGEGYSTICLAGIKRLFPHQLDMLEQKTDNRNIAKSTWTELSVHDINDARHTLYTANGTDLFALWNLLLMGIRMERPSR